MTQQPDSHVFTILLRVADADEPDNYARRAYEDPHLQDLLLGGPDRTNAFEADFERKAPSFAEAVLSALNDLTRVFPEAELLRVEPDDLATIAGIAARMGRSHESVRLLARGERGPGGFPQSAGLLDAKTQVWRWHEVADWFGRAMGVKVPAGDHAALLAAVNDILELRRIAADVIDGPAVAARMAALLPHELSRVEIPLKR